MSLVWPILAHLSAEPLVGLKLEDGPQRGVRGGLSAEPLVGLKQARYAKRLHSGMLSAEPLVGLKQAVRFRRPQSGSTFSRTPRGFEALDRRSKTDRPLSFQPNPSWV